MKTAITLLLLLCLPISLNAYEFNGKTYKIRVPESINFYERAVMTGNCEMSKYECKFAYANILLIKKGFKPLY